MNVIAEYEVYELDEDKYSDRLHCRVGVAIRRNGAREWLGAFIFTAYPAVLGEEPGPLQPPALGHDLWDEDTQYQSWDFQRLEIGDEGFRPWQAMGTLKLLAEILDVPTEPPTSGPDDDLYLLLKHFNLLPETV